MVRFKNRYLLCEIFWEDGKIDESLLTTTIVAILKASLELNFGEFACGTQIQTMQIKYFNPLTNIFIIRATRTHFRMVWGAITFITNIDGRAASIRVIHVGGSIKSCQKAAVQHDENLLALLRDKAQQLQKGTDTSSLSGEDFISL